MSVNTASVFVGESGEGGEALVDVLFVVVARRWDAVLSYLQEVAKAPDDFTAHDFCD